MSLTPPSTQQVSDNIVAQIQATINQTIPLLPKAFIRVMAKAVAGLFVLLYKYAGFMFLQMFVRFASDKETTVNGVKLTPLIQWGRLIGVDDPTAATRWEGTTTVVVTNQTGTLADGTPLLNSDNGVTYITIGDTALDAATKSVIIRASGDENDTGGRGTIGNLEVGDIVSFINPIPNVASDTAVNAVTTTGADAEGTELYRQRIQDRFQQQPQGGAYADYAQWAKEVEGIVNAYPYTGDPGQVDVYCEATPVSSGSADGIPTAAQLTAVGESIELDDAGLASRRPASTFVNVYAITRVEFDVNVVGLELEGGADTSQIEADIATALGQYFAIAEPYIIGLVVPPRKDQITKSAISGTVQDVVGANNAVFQGVTVAVGGVDKLIYILQEGEKAKTGTISFT